MSDSPPASVPAPFNPLTTLGWTPALDELFAPFRAAGLEPARVAVEDKHHYLVCTAQAELLAQITGKFLHDAPSTAELPKVGDWAAVSRLPGENKAAIHYILPRRTKLSRKVPGRRIEEQVLATNIDTVFVVQALDASFDPRKFERYLVMIHESGAQPVVVLNKTDLCPAVERRMAEAHAAAGAVPIVAVSAKTGFHLRELKQWLGEGLTLAFVGPSGVGKSTLINRLYGEEIQDTIPVRDSDAKGRHTTSRRELIILPQGGLLIDTPGLREFHVWVAEHGLGDAFPEIERLAVSCHCRACSHTREPRCAVLEALGRGQLTRASYDSFQKLRGELEQVQAALVKSSQLERKRQTQAAQRAFQKLKHGDFEEPE